MLLVGVKERDKEKQKNFLLCFWVLFIRFLKGSKVTRKRFREVAVIYFTASNSVFTEGGFSFFINIYKSQTSRVERKMSASFKYISL